MDPHMSHTHHRPNAESVAATIDKVKARIAYLQDRDCRAVKLIRAQMMVVEQGHRARVLVIDEIRAAETDLTALVNAPPSREVNPTEWLPNELLWLIFLILPYAGACRGVCRRWRALCDDKSVQRKLWANRWEAFSLKWISPTLLTSNTVSSVYCLAIGRKDRLYSGSSDKPVRVWSTDNGRNLLSMEGHTERVYAVAADEAGHVYSASADGSIRVWSSVDGSFQKLLLGHTAGVLSLAISPGGHLFSGSKDQTMKMWSTSTWTSIRTIEGHFGAVFALATAPDGTVYSGSADATIRKHSKDGTYLKTLIGHYGAVYAVAVGTDDTLYSGSSDCTICVWSGTTGVLLRTLRGHSDAIFVLTVSPDNTLFSGSSDKTIRVWCPRGAQLYTLRGHTGFVEALVFGSDGRLYSGARDEASIRVW
jgi:WD40 repeat protein